MYEYGKTENLFARDPDTHKVIHDPKPQFDQIASWLVTEKIDGTSMRLVCDRTDRERRKPVLRGRSDNANVHPNFFEEAFPHFGGDEDDLLLLLNAALNAIQKPDPEGQATYSMVVFGEGYGPGIQRGGGYSPVKRFRAFDVATFKTEYRPSLLAEFSGTGNLMPVTSGPLWRPFEDVKTVAEFIGIHTVPVVSWFQRMDTNEIVRYVREDHVSITAGQDTGTETTLKQEGVVARTDPYLYDSRGARVMFKMKQKDMH